MGTPSSNQCKICGDKEYILRKGSLTPCQCLIMKKRLAYAESIIPTRYRDSHINRLKPISTIKIAMDRQQKVIEIIQSDPLGGYLFFGPTGVGKTHLMYALVDHAIRAGRRTVAMTCSQFIKMSRDSEFNKEETPLLDQDLISIYTASEEPMGKTLHVFLDEMDKIKLSEYSQLLLFDLVNAAYDYPNRIKITITSNLPPVDFEQAFGAAFLRKLKSISKPIIYGVN